MFDNDKEKLELELKETKLRKKEIISELKKLNFQIKARKEKLIILNYREWQIENKLQKENEK